MLPVPPEDKKIPAPGSGAKNQKKMIAVTCALKWRCRKQALPHLLILFIVLSCAASVYPAYNGYLTLDASSSPDFEMPEEYSAAKDDTVRNAFSSELFLKNPAGRSAWLKYKTFILPDDMSYNTGLVRYDYNLSTGTGLLIQGRNITLKGANGLNGLTLGVTKKTDKILSLAELRGEGVLAERGELYGNAYLRFQGEFSPGTKTELRVSFLEPGRLMSCETYTLRVNQALFPSTVFSARYRYLNRPASLVSSTYGLEIRQAAGFYGLIILGYRKYDNSLGFASDMLHLDFRYNLEDDWEFSAGLRYYRASKDIEIKSFGLSVTGFFSL